MKKRTFRSSTMVRYKIYTPAAAGYHGGWNDHARSTSDMANRLGVVPGRIAYLTSRDPGPSTSRGMDIDAVAAFSEG